MRTSYDPNKAPDPKVWLALTQREKYLQIESYHRDFQIHQSNIIAHYSFHAFVEDDVAEKKEAVIRTMARLSVQGLSRHDCIHAISWVIAKILREAETLDDEGVKVIEPEKYFAALDELQAANWLSRAE